MSFTQGTPKANLYMASLSPYLENTVSGSIFMLPTQKNKREDFWIPVNLLHMFIKDKLLFLVNFGLFKKQIHI